MNLLKTENMTISIAIELFKLSPNFSKTQLDKAFKQSMLKHHTDRGGTLQASMAVNAAYELLNNTFDPKKLLVKKSLVNPWSSQETEERLIEIRIKINRDRAKIAKNELGLEQDKHYSSQEILQARLRRAKNQLGLEEEKDYSSKEILQTRGSEEKHSYIREIKARRFLLKQLDLMTNPLRTLKNEVDEIYNKITTYNVIAAIMIFKTEESLIEFYEPDPTNTRGNYEAHDTKDQKSLDTYSKKLKVIAKKSGDDLKNILFDFFEKKFLKKAKNPKTGIIPIKDVLKPWKKFKGFLKKFYISKDVIEFSRTQDVRIEHIDWRNSKLSNVKWGRFDYYF